VANFDLSASYFLILNSSFLLLCLQALQNLAYFVLVLRLFLGRDPIGEDHDLVLNRNKRDADRTRAVFVFAVIDQLVHLFPVQLKFALFLGGLIEFDFVFLEKRESVVEFSIHSLLTANSDRGQINGRIRTLSGNSIVHFFRFPIIRERDGSDGKFVARQFQSLGKCWSGEERRNGNEGED
jgi:hypothetical protein